jgi:hypothetical protein
LQNWGVGIRGIAATRANSCRQDLGWSIKPQTDERDTMDLCQSGDAAALFFFEKGCVDDRRIACG